MKVFKERKIKLYLRMKCFIQCIMHKHYASKKLFICILKWFKSWKMLGENNSCKGFLWNLLNIWETCCIQIGIIMVAYLWMHLRSLPLKGYSGGKKQWMREWNLFFSTAAHSKVVSLVMYQAWYFLVFRNSIYCCCQMI